jgi:hypothetical protein
MKAVLFPAADISQAFGGTEQDRAHCVSLTRSLLFFAVFILGSAALSAKEYEVWLKAGDSDHAGAIITVAAPPDFPQVGMLISGREETPFQKNSNGEVLFTVRSLKRGETKKYNIDASREARGLGNEMQDGKITIARSGQKLFTYQGEESELPRPDIKPQFKRGGYLHPVYSPSGRVVTDDYAPNHLHHHGIWFPWTKTVFEGRQPDFWNMGEGKGKVGFVSFGDRWSGPVHAGFFAHHSFIDLTASERKKALEETWQVTAYTIPGADYTVFDLVSTQKCATASPLQLPKYHYGGLGFRGNWAWNGADKCLFLTSNGETNRVVGNETRGNWCHIGGMVDGTLTGIAILCHPDNFRAPQPMRLHPSEPFFCFAPSQLGDWSIDPGKAYVSKYRFVVQDGPPNKQQLDTLWRSYAKPATATIRDK